MMHEDFKNILKADMESIINEKDFTDFIQYMEDTQLRYNRKYEKFFRLDTGHLDKGAVSDLFYQTKIKIGDQVKKKSNKPFKSKLHIETVTNYAFNQNDPHHRIALLFSDGSLCNIRQVIKVIV